jgi:hypothetical protein
MVIYGIFSKRNLAMNADWAIEPTVADDSQSTGPTTTTPAAAATIGHSC